MEDSVRTAKMEFRGYGFEYFKIWIVNIALSIVTLFIYSAWAKVRTKKYFYGNTYLFGSSFNYTANPLNILKGRIIVALLFGSYGALYYYMQSNIILAIPLVLLGLAILFLTPWFIMRAISFNARYSSYRNVNFSFHGKYFFLFLYYIVVGFLNFGFAGLAAPAIKFIQRRYQVDQMKYGLLSFRNNAKLGDYYLTYLFVWLGAIVAMLLAAVLGLIAYLVGGLIFSFTNPTVISTAFSVGYVSLLLSMYGAKFALKGGITKLMLDKTEIGNLKLECSLRIPRYLWIMLSNMFFLSITLGIYYPWAATRISRYLSSTIAVTGREDDFITMTDAASNITAIGDEAGDFISFDIGF